MGGSNIEMREKKELKFVKKCILWNLLKFGNLLKIFLQTSLFQPVDGKITLEYHAVILSKKLRKYLIS